MPSEIVPATAGRLDGRCADGFGRVGGVGGLFAGRLDVVTADPADGTPGVPGFVSGLFAGRLDAVTALCETFIGGFPELELLGRGAGTSTGFGATFGATFATCFPAGFVGALVFVAALVTGFTVAFAAGFGVAFDGDFGAAFDFGCGFGEPMSREKIPFFSAMRRHKACEVGDAAAVAPLVVVPGDDLREGAVQHHGARRVND